VKVFLASVFAQLFLNPYVFLRGWQAIPPKNIWRIPFILFFSLELLVFFTGYFFYISLPDEIMVYIYNVCGAWYISLLYITMTLLGIEIIRFSHRIWHWFPSCVLRHWKKVKLMMFFAVVIFIIILMMNAYNTVMNPIVRHVYINVPDKSEINRHDSLNIVLMSDVHIGEIITKDLVRRYVSMSNSLNPDIVLLAGDILDYDLHSAQKYHFDSVLMQLHAPLGVYAVNGNHEYRANRFSKWNWIRQCGIKLLIDSVALIDSSFYLVGRDDYVNENRQPIQALIKNLDRGRPTIMLDHQPRSFVEASMNGIDLTLCGHTHYGQFWPYSLIMHLIYKCPYGYYRRGHSQFYISSGIGIAGPPYRVGTVSEMVMLHIRFL
jgi:predicted MPP superfamily phosphohydrolase